MLICPRCGEQTAQSPCAHCGGHFADAVVSTKRQRSSNPERLAAAETQILRQRQQRAVSNSLDALGGQCSLGGYRFDRPLAKGGMGSLWRATRISDHQAVVIKTPLWRDEDAQLRFTREARALSTCQHPNIVNLIDIDMTSDHQPLLVMEHVPGQTLRDIFMNRPFHAAEFELLGRELARAIDHCHRRGIIHRDIKPENVIMQDDQVTLIDFSLALIDQQQAPSLFQATPQGYILGTPPYAAPEQLRNPSQIGAHADLYSLGILLDECLHHTRLQEFEQKRLKQWQSLIRLCCHYHPEQRPNLDNILHFCQLDAIKHKTIHKTPKQIQTKPRRQYLSLIPMIVILSSIISFAVYSLLPEHDLVVLRGQVHTQDADDLIIDRHGWPHMILQAQGNTQIRLPGSGNWRQQIRISGMTSNTIPIRVRDPDGQWQIHIVKD